MIIVIHFYLVPPRVKPKPEDGNIVVKKGTEVALECNASGNPVPTITWTREVCKYLKFFLFFVDLGKIICLFWTNIKKSILKLKFISKPYFWTGMYINWWSCWHLSKLKSNGKHMILPIKCFVKYAQPPTFNSWTTKGIFHPIKMPGEKKKVHFQKK